MNALKGQNKFILNEATIKEAIQQYLENGEIEKPNWKVTAVTTGYEGGAQIFVATVTEQTDV